ncbi:MAG: hypothetical protein RL013_2425 [Bacteroidota bacterium]
MIPWISHGLSILLLCITATVSLLFSGESLMHGLLYILILLISERLTGITAYGCRADSRGWFTGVFLALSPVLMTSGHESVERVSGVLFSLFALYAAVEWWEGGSEKWILLLLLAGLYAIMNDVRLAGLLLPVTVQLFVKTASRGNSYRSFAVVGSLFLLAWVASVYQFQRMSWDIANLAGAGEVTGNTGEVPGLLYIFYPLAHPWFCVLLPGLFLLYRKTDVVNPARRMLLAGAVCYLLLLGGLPGRELFSLVPAYVILLIAVFPSWDRMYCYGLYFFRKTVWLTIGILTLIQIMMVVYKTVTHT